MGQGAGWVEQGDGGSWGAAPFGAGGVCAQLAVVWQDAAVIAVLAAVGACLAFQAHGIIIQQKLLADAGGDVVPGEGLIQGAGALAVEEGIDTFLGEGILPGLKLELVAPGIKARTLLKGLEDDLPDAAIGTGKPGLELGGIRPVKCGLDAGLVKAVADEADLLVDEGGVFGRLPLEGGMRLGNEGVDADTDAGTAADDGTGFAVDAAADGDDGLDVFHRLAGETDHEIELEAEPAVTKDGADRFEEFFIGQGLVDDAAQALGGRFGGDGETTAGTQIPELVHQFNGEGGDAQGGEGDREAAVLEIALDL